MVTPQPTSLLPSPTLQITRFLQFVKNVYADHTSANNKLVFVENSN